MNHNQPAPAQSIKEEDLKIYRDRYRVFIEDVADGYYETNLQGDFKFFNKALCNIFGYPRNEIQNSNYRKFMDEKHVYRVILLSDGLANVGPSSRPSSHSSFLAPAPEPFFWPPPTRSSRLMACGAGIQKRS